MWLLESGVGGGRFRTENFRKFTENFPLIYGGHGGGGWRGFRKIFCKDFFWKIYGKFPLKLRKISCKFTEANFPKISRKFPENLRKFSVNLRKMSFWLFLHENAFLQSPTGLL